MKFRNQIYDAMKYTLKDWKAIILLGTVLCIASTVEELHTKNLTIHAILFIISAATLLFEEGYRYRIIENTIKGDNSPPIIGNTYKLMKDGFVELITLNVYILILNGMNILIDKFNGMKLPGIALIFFVTGCLIYSLFIASAINKTLHGGKFLSGFNIVEIFRLYKKIGLKESIFLIVVGAISLNLVYSCIFDLSIFSEATYIIDFLASFILNPILLLFITRLTASCGREATRD